jgi:hypothetical protein
MNTKALKRIAHGKPLSEAKDWKTAEARVTAAIADAKKAKSHVKGVAQEVQRLLTQAQGIATGVSERIGDVSAELIDDMGRSGLDPRVSAIESLQDQLDGYESETHEAIYALEYITGRVPAEKTVRSQSRTKPEFQREIAQAKALARQASKLVKDAAKELEKADLAAQDAIDRLPDDDEERFYRNEGRYTSAVWDGDADNVDSWADALQHAEASLSYII